MNKIDLWVIEIIGSPYIEYNKYFLDVMAESHGTTSYHSLMFDTFNEANNIEIGYKFLA